MNRRAGRFWILALGLLSACDPSPRRTSLADLTHKDLPRLKAPGRESGSDTVRCVAYSTAPCPWCKGSGHVSCTQCDGLTGGPCASCRGVDLTRLTCTACKGQDLTTLPCNTCKGVDLTQLTCNSCKGRDLTEIACAPCKGRGCLYCGDSGKNAACRYCSGSGKQAACHKCSGRGKQSSCLYCGGAGRQSACLYCEGKGTRSTCPSCEGLQSVACGGCEAGTIYVASSAKPPLESLPVQAEDGSRHGERTMSGEARTVFVRGYTRPDGTEVQSTYRPAPERTYYAENADDDSGRRYRPVPSP